RRFAIPTTTSRATRPTRSTSTASRAWSRAWSASFAIWRDSAAKEGGFARGGLVAKEAPRRMMARPPARASPTADQAVFEAPRMSAYKSDFLNVLATRGFIHQVSEPEALDA